MRLNPVDYVVIAAYLAAITAFGSWFARFQKTTRDYFLTGRSVPWWGVCFTIVATETSTLSFIGVPAEVFAPAGPRYTGNMTFLQLVLGYIVGRVLVSVLLVPAYFRGELFTSYELLQRRFGAPVKNLAALIFLFGRSLADGIRLFATALVVSVVTGVPVTWTVIVIGAAMILYTTRGGVAAVIWTDAVQMFVYVLGALVVAAGLLARLPGGCAAALEAAAAAGKLTVFDLSFDPRRTYTLWAGLAGGVALTLATHGTDQFLVQRLLAARSARDAARGLVLSGVIVFVQFVLFLFIGILLYAYYQQRPLPPDLGPDQVLARFVVEGLPPGIVGFIVAAIVAAALSPSLNALAATTVNDFYLRYVRPGAGEAERMRVSKAATVFWGLVQLGIALGAQRMDQSVLSAGLAVLSVTAGPVLGAFLLGVLTARVDAWSVVAGMIAGTLAVGWIWWTGAAAWTWYALVGATTTAGVALAVWRARRPGERSFGDPS
ncbi:MAG TPA: sodium:solute symporter [Candidatus Tectomicrobia bacterium]|nr:sodium:solute symporter [Candidatus Tectomicrobia bacterium]